MDKYKFGEFIYQKRKALKLTQEELGKKLGVTNKAVSKWEVGETTPDITMLEPLASILQVTVDELLKQETQNDKNIQVNKINKLFIILTIILSTVLMLTLSTVFGISMYNKLKEYEVVLDQSTYKEILNIDPMTNFICDDQGIIISSSYELYNKYYIKENEEISFIITYEINYFYLDNNDKLCVITYYARTKQVTLTSDKTKEIDTITLYPQTQITNYKSFKQVTVTYNIDNYTGEVYKVKLK